MPPPGRLDHRLAAVDADDRTPRRHQPRQRRGVVAQAAADVQDSAARRGAEQSKALALALGEERDRLDEVQATREHREVRGAVNVLEPRGKSSFIDASR